jgi:hypothetical protein
MKIKFELNYKCFTFLFGSLYQGLVFGAESSRRFEFCSTKDDPVSIIGRFDELSSVVELEGDDFLGVFWLLELVCLQRDSDGTD